ncbi:MAG TPA: LysR family transcriptional regulator [Terriglobales bacterium]|nr:LysR family transcriptional regulator [Terriglobales bacterium]
MDNNLELLPDLRVFVAVVENNGFTAAANQLGTSTAAISRAIRRLEERLGGPILHRTTRRVGLTERGTRLYAQSHERLRELQRALDDVKSSGSEPRGLLRVTCAQTFGRRVIAPAIIDFRILYPDIEVELNLSDEIADLMTGGFHIAIRGGRPTTGRHIARRLAPAPLYTCASPALLRRYAPPNRAEDFRALPCIGFRFRSTGEKLAWEFIEDGHPLSVDVNAGLWVDDNEVARDAALAGLGFAQLPGYIATEAIRAGRLVPILLHTVAANRSFSVQYLHRSEQQPLRARLFVDHLLSAMSDTSSFQLTAAELKHWSAKGPEWSELEP